MDAASGREIWRHDLGVPIVNAPVVNGGRIFVSTHDNHFYALAEADGRTLWDQQGMAESAGHPVVHQRGGVGPVRDRALYLRRTFRAARPERPGRPGTTCCPVAARSPPCRELDDIAARPVIDRDMVFAISHSGVMAAISIGIGRPRLDARHRRHPDALGGGRLCLCA